MKILTNTAVFIMVKTILVYCNPVTNQTDTKASSPYKELDAANLETLNREIRKALLKLVGDELATTRAVMNSIQPEVNECQTKVDQRYSECVRCVDLKCQNRYNECKGKIEIIAPNRGGVSVSSSVNERGRPTTTFCTVAWGQSEACTTVMNPDGAFATSINSMGNNLHVHLQSAVNDLGGNVGVFINQMQGVVGDINTTQITNEELERMLAELNSGLSNMQFELQQMMDGFGENMQQSMANLDQSLSQIEPNVNLMVSQIGPNMRQMGPNIRRQVSEATSGLSQIRPNVNSYVSRVTDGVGDMLFNLHQGMGQWGHNFGQSMQNMLSGMFGRKKRQVQIIADPSHEVKCETMLKNSTVCAEYRTKCQSCPQTGNVTEGDIIKQVCGDIVVDKIMRINDKLTELTEIEATVVGSRQIVSKVEMDKSSWNADKFAFSKIFVTAGIKGSPVRFSSKSALKLMDLPTTGQTIAKQIWRYWNDPSVEKPK